jgi:hypothetical protein
MSNNSHLVPVVIQDIVAKLPTSKGNEKMMLIARLEAIVQFCQKALK